MNLSLPAMSEFPHHHEWVSLEKGLNLAPSKPGVYVIAQKSRNITDGTLIKLKDIKYVGQTTAVGGLKRRLRQFKRGIEKGRGHSCGNRLYKEGIGCKDLYVAYKAFDASTAKHEREKKDLLVMAKIKSMEYEILAAIRNESNSLYQNVWNIQ